MVRACSRGLVAGGIRRQFFDCEKAVDAEPGFEQGGPLVESLVAFAEAYAMGAVLEDVSFGGDAGFDFSFVEAEALFEGDSLVIFGMKPEGGRGFGGDVEVGRVGLAEVFALFHGVEEFAVAEVRGVGGDGADPWITED